ncbi:MAG: hypothetical protein LBD06_02675 [Candidatus Accumulibacter sp.]|nr:hypothetical protein [Accumulibacter sp.]
MRHFAPFRGRNQRTVSEDRSLRGQKTESEDRDLRGQKTEKPSARFFCLTRRDSAANSSVFCPLKPLFSQTSVL